MTLQLSQCCIYLIILSLLLVQSVFFLPLVLDHGEYCQHDLKARFWELLFWAEFHHVEKMRKALVDHGGRYYDYYEFDSLVGSGSDQANRESHSARLSPGTQIQLLKAQVEQMRTETDEMDSYYTTEINKVEWDEEKELWTTNEELQSMTQESQTKMEVYAQLKDKIEEAAR